MKKNSEFLVVVFCVIVVVLFFVFPLKRRVPTGLPTHYYDLVDSASNEDTNIIIFSDSIDLNNHVKFIQADFLKDYYSSNLYRYNYLVVDIEKYSESYTDGDMLNDIYSSSCVTLVIANYREADVSITFDFLDVDDYDSDLIFVQNNDLCNNNYTKNIIGNEFPEDLYLNFAIIDNISYDREE